MSVTRTGVLSVTSNPRNAQIYLDGQYTGVNSPDVLKQVMPGEYFVELKKDGFKPWSGTIDINSGEATKLQDVLMFLDTEPRLLFNKQTNELEVDNTGQAIAYTISEGGWKELWIYYPEKNTHILLDQISDSEKNNWQFSWSSGGSYLMNLNTISSELSLYNKDGSQIEFLFDDEILEAKWHPSADKSILLTTKYGLTQFDVQTGNTQSFSPDDDTTVILDASIIKLIDSGNYTEVAQYINGQKDTLALLPKAQYTIEERDGAYLILTDNTNGLYLIEIHKEQPILLHVEATIYDWNAEADMLAFSDGFELSVYNTKVHQVELITRQSALINSILWHPNGEVVFVEDDVLYAYETYAIAKQRFVTTLLENAQINELWISEDGSNIYFYGAENGAQGVYSLNLSGSLTDAYIF
jgi:hypothetical protein